MIEQGGLAGTRVLSLIALKRDLFRLVIWWVAIIGTMVATIPTLDEVLGTDAQRAAHTVFMRSPIGVMMAGPGYGLGDPGLGPHFVAEYLQVFLITVAILSILTVVRHTRAEEDSGRAELLRARVVGRSAGLTSAIILMIGINLVIGVGITVGLAGFGLGGSDAVALGLGVALCGIAFGGIAAITSQFFIQAKSSSGVAFYLLAGFFVLRAFGDIAGIPALSWLSPLAWTQRMRLYADVRWWPLLLYVVLSIACFWIALVLQSRRDLGGGLVSPRAGRATAPATLTGSVGLFWRLMRGSLIGWSIGVFLTVFLIGLAANAIYDLMETSPEMLIVLGGDINNLVEGYFALLQTYVTMAAAGFAIASAVLLRSQEDAGLAGVVLAGRTGRLRWFGAGIAVTALNTTLLMLVGGLGLGLSAWLVDGEASWLSTMLGAALSQLPAPLIFGGVTFLLVGLLPRATNLIWLIFSISALITAFGQMFSFPDWTLKLSPFEILPKTPLEDFELMPVLVLGLVAMVTAVIGAAGFRRRDLRGG